jgi:serine/threonine protein phosphatase PrpC
MMLDEAEYLYDTALMSAIGRRELQEDAVAGHFPAGSGLGYVVLADGMGGHACGDVASRIVVQEFSEELARYAGDPAGLERDVGAILRGAMTRANGQVARHATDQPDRRGMGSTLVAPLILRNRLYWISVGDSPLYLLRGNRMSRLNQEHSMAQHLDRMVTKGLISQIEADQNPDRYCLTSGLLGLEVPEIDCRDRPIELQDGDILIVASDGLLTLDEQRIAALVYEGRDQSSAEINSRLLQVIRETDDPDQDNVTLCVVKIGLRSAAPDQRAAAGVRTTIQLRVPRPGKRVVRRIIPSTGSKG